MHKCLYQPCHVHTYTSMYVHRVCVRCVLVEAGERAQGGAGMVYKQGYIIIYIYIYVWSWPTLRLRLAVAHCRERIFHTFLIAQSFVLVLTSVVAKVMFHCKAPQSFLCLLRPHRSNPSGREERHEEVWSKWCKHNFLLMTPCVYGFHLTQ